MAMSGSQKTGLSVTATPGPAHSFAAKTEAVVGLVGLTGSIIGPGNAGKILGPNNVGEVRG